MPAKSKSQQRFFGMVDAYKKGELKKPSKAIKDAAKGMTKKELEDFASTKTDKLPEKVNEGVIRLNEDQLKSLIKESIHRILMLKEDYSSYSPICKWNYFCANYPHDFIEKVWADDKMMARHLNEKFGAFYESSGAYGVMLKFYLSLDSTNKKKLEDYVMNNFSC